MIKIKKNLLILHSSYFGELNPNWVYIKFLLENEIFNSYKYIEKII